jgi:hypothetical protein
MIEYEVLNLPSHPFVTLFHLMPYQEVITSFLSYPLLLLPYLKLLLQDSPSEALTFGVPIRILVDIAGKNHYLHAQSTSKLLERDLAKSQPKEKRTLIPLSPKAPQFMRKIMPSSAFSISFLQKKNPEDAVVLSSGDRFELNNLNFVKQNFEFLKHFVDKVLFFSIFLFFFHSISFFSFSCTVAQRRGN